MKTPKLTQEIKNMWIKALKSGKYVQGKDKLKENTPEGMKHCCLGVLCEIHPELNINIQKDEPIIINNPDFNGSYSIFHKMFNQNNIKFSKIINTNDLQCDGKYTAVIPLIEAIRIF